MRLTEQEIKQRFVRLQNLERLYPIARKRIEKLEKENRELRLLVKQQGEIIQAQAAIIEKFKLRIEDLEIKIFGKKKDKKKDKDRGSDDSQKNPRPADSYRKPIPRPEEIAKTREYPIADCPDCGAPLTNIKTLVRYKIELAILGKALKEIEKQNIQSGFCPKCQKWFSAIPIRPSPVYFGQTVKAFANYCLLVLRLSFSQTKDILKTLADIDISDGELANVLQEHGKILNPEYEQLKTRIQNQPNVHYDETTYRVPFGTQGNYAWIMAGSMTDDAVFSIGQTRGKGNAQNLKGSNNPEQIGITDDYGAYKNLFGGRHQLCWAHLLRKARDLAQSDQLPKEKQNHCQKIHQTLKQAFRDLKQELARPFDANEFAKTEIELGNRLAVIAKPNIKDPAQMATIKKSLAKNIKHYFTCLRFPAVPLTNNKAERLLRHLVLKRRNSLGCKTQLGADTMSVLYSVLISLWRRNPATFFAEYLRLLGPA